MTLLPMSSVGRAITAAWLISCVGVLVFAWVQQDIHDMPIAFFWLMIFLTAPVGFPVGIGIGTATSALSTKFGIPYQAFLDLVPMWLALTVAGYVQWFVIVPSVWRAFRPTTSSNSSFEKGRRKSAAPLN